MMRRNRPSFLISYLNTWVVLTGFFFRKPVLLILCINQQAKEYFLGISSYISYLHMFAFAKHESFLFIFAWTSVRNLHTLMNSVYCCCTASWGGCWANILSKGKSTNSAIEILGFQYHWEYLKCFYAWFYILSKIIFRNSLCSC